MTIILYIALALASIICCSCLEWLLHKYVMHKPLLGFKYPFIAHEKVHHEKFGWKESYHLEDEKDRKIIKMAWWNGPALICMTTSIPLLLSYYFSFWELCTTFGVVVTLYYSAYEYLHLCMHEPKNRWFEKSRFFKFLDNHHRIHHLKMNGNLNVVLPFADWLMGTLIIKSPRPFPV